MLTGQDDGVEWLNYKAGIINELPTVWWSFELRGTGADDAGILHSTGESVVL